MKGKKRQNKFKKNLLKKKPRFMDFSVGRYMRSLPYKRLSSISNITLFPHKKKDLMWKMYAASYDPFKRKYVLPMEMESGDFPVYEINLTIPPGNSSEEKQRAREIWDLTRFIRTAQMANKNISDPSLYPGRYAVLARKYLPSISSCNRVPSFNAHRLQAMRNAYKQGDFQALSLLDTLGSVASPIVKEQNTGKSSSFSIPSQLKDAVYSLPYTTGELWQFYPDNASNEEVLNSSGLYPNFDVDEKQE